MYVCVCKAVTESDLSVAIRAGARTLGDLKRGLGVATECGRCATCARECLRASERRPAYAAIKKLSPPSHTLSESV